MKKKHVSKKKLWKFKIVKLQLRYRILLYSLMIVFTVLSLISVTFSCFPYITNIFIYVLAACTMFLSCYYLVLDIRYAIGEVIKPKIVANSYTNRLVTDYRLRTVLLTVPGLASNLIFAILNGLTGIISHSVWFGSLSAYYILLSMMRIEAVNKEREIVKIKKQEERIKKEIEVYEKTSILFIIMAVVLCGMTVLLEHSLGGKSYPGFTIFAVATYAFYKIIISTINLIKQWKRKSPLLMIIRKIGYIDACVSIFTLQTAMFVYVGEEGEIVKIANRLTGTAVCLIVLGMGIQGICSSKNMRLKVKLGGSRND